MPLKFWKRERRPPSPPEESRPPKKAKPPSRGKPPSKEADAERLDSKLRDVHAQLVDLGLTSAGTFSVFRTRVRNDPGLGSFLESLEEEPWKHVTSFVASWLGFRVPERFDLADLLYAANQRLSSFGLTIIASDEVWVDQPTGVREATLTLGEEVAVEIRFRTPRDVFVGINELLSDRDLAFLELETWADVAAFMLVRRPRWDRLSTAALVVVKSERTAGGGECRECESSIGSRWASCIACGAAQP